MNLELVTRSQLLAEDKHVVVVENRRSSSSRKIPGANVVAIYFYSQCKVAVCKSECEYGHLLHRTGAFFGPHVCR